MDIKKDSRGLFGRFDEWFYYIPMTFFAEFDVHGNTLKIKPNRLPFKYIRHSGEIRYTKVWSVITILI